MTRPSVELPDLSFPQISYGRLETPWDLRCLLYRGGAATNSKHVLARIDSGQLGKPIIGRVPLVTEIHRVLIDRLVSGGSRATTRGLISTLRQFYSWFDNHSIASALSIESIQADYTEWTNHLLWRTRELAEIDSSYALDQAGTIGSIVNEILDLNISVAKKTLLFRTFAGSRRRRKGAKQNLENTFGFGNALFDITKSLTTEAIRSPLPIKITFRDGTVIDEWTRLREPSKVRHLSPDVPDSWTKRWVVEQRQAWSDDTSLRTRRPLANLRMEAELLIFIAQTGMNLAQAHSIKAGHFTYASHLDGYQVRRRYKNRRNGEVEFEIFSEYRPHFEAYLAWRTEMFGGASDLLFPIESHFRRARDMPPKFSSVRKRLNLIGLPFVPPRELRKTRVNWIRRRSKDDQMAAEMVQHTLETSLSDYDRPDHQVAVIEISKFHELSRSAIEAPGPVACAGGPAKAIVSSETAPKPDCVSPAGCLFCFEQRDVDSFDHIWSLATFRHLKSLELARYRPSTNDRLVHPAEEAIDVITKKFERFRAHPPRAAWMIEALQRIEEGDFHPRWHGFVRLMEIRR